VVKAVLSKLPLWLFPSFPPYGQSSVCVSVIPKSPLAYYSLPPQSLWLQPTSSSWAAPSSPMPLGWACLQPPCKTTPSATQTAAIGRDEGGEMAVHGFETEQQKPASLIPSSHLSQHRPSSRYPQSARHGAVCLCHVISRGKF
jgi:hypothetical protein